MPWRSEAPRCEVAHYGETSGAQHTRNRDAAGSAQVELSENDLLPRVDLSFELAEPFGSIGEGGASRDTRDAIVGSHCFGSIGTAPGRGRLSQAQSRMEALKQQRRKLEDQIAVELRNILLELNVARRLMQLAALEVEQSETMRRAEQRRFRQGASDFFLVNVREETAADARVRYFDAYRAAQLAQAAFHAATVNLAPWPPGIAAVARLRAFCPIGIHSGQPGCKRERHRG